MRRAVPAWVRRGIGTLLIGLLVGGAVTLGALASVGIWGNDSGTPAAKNSASDLPLVSTTAKPVEPAAGSLGRTPVLVPPESAPAAPPPPVAVAVPPRPRVPAPPPPPAPPPAPKPKPKPAPKPKPTPKPKPRPPRTVDFDSSG